MIEPTRYHDWFLADLFGQPRLLFALWVVREGLCASADDFRQHFGDGFARDALLDVLVEHGLIEREGATIRLTRAGQFVIAGVWAQEAVSVADPTRAADPVAPPEAPADSAGVGPHEPGHVAGGEPPDRGQVLVVDDEAPIREALRDMLQYEGYSVLEAGDGAAALRILRSSRRSMVVMVDTMMPIMDGVELLRTVAADPALGGRHHFVVMSSSMFPGLARLGVPVVMKPFEIDDVVSLVDRMATRAG